MTGLNSLLFICGTTKGNDFNMALSDAFKGAGFPFYNELHYSDDILTYGRPEMNRRIVAYARQIKPQAIFIQHMDYGDISLESIKEFRKITQCVICWTGDIREPRPHWYRDIYSSAIACYSNMDDVNEARNAGYKSYFFNHYHEKAYYSMHLPPEGKKHDIVFMGSRYDRHPLSAARNEMVRFLSNTYRDRFHLYGNSWGDLWAGFATRAQSCMVYNKTKIAINYSQVSAGRYTSDRLMHIMGSGCFCLCKHYPDAEVDLGADGYAVRFFNTNEELKQLCDYYMNDDNIYEREGIAARGYELVKERFGNDNLIHNVKKIFSECNSEG